MVGLACSFSCRTGEGVSGARGDRPSPQLSVGDLATHLPQRPGGKEIKVESSW